MGSPKGRIPHEQSAFFICPPCNRKPVKKVGPNIVFWISNKSFIKKKNVRRS